MLALIALGGQSGNTDSSPVQLRETLGPLASHSTEEVCSCLFAFTNRCLMPVVSISECC